MTTHIEGLRLKDAYRVAVACGLVAQQRNNFRMGRAVRAAIDGNWGLSDSPRLAVGIVGSFQLRYGPTTRPDGKSTDYSVWGRVEGSTAESDWIPVDGPWEVGKGPFDNRR